MRMKLQLHEVLEEYTLYIPDFDEILKGRLSISLVNKDNPESKSEYHWEVSHYYKGTESAAGAYIPSIRSYDDMELCRKTLFAYMRSFTNIGVEKNKYY